ncbi:type II secretion system F family protein [Sedimentitalea sp. JM2-8]|uniref:Type II secretion system F family protein n=1 Tax=Sedimentitalea xiamensis TaxID=3050037 RepID=A0ABT7FC17_9RHOB|nr:type II secretion system F family protein [Sedimentitalea xiamensis]MDK3072573.1 type II secretion system F family protein [Sedimentitalea xiamensis]
MERNLEIVADRFGIPVETLLLTGLGLGVVLLFVSVASALSQRNPAAARIAGLRARQPESRQDRGLLLKTVRTPTGLFKAALPSKDSERLKIEEKLLQAGLTGRNALRNYTLTRVWFGLFLPIAVAALILGSKVPGTPVPDVLADVFAPMNQSNAVQLVGVLAGLGYLLPAAWLNHRQRTRQRKLAEAFPNALDLLQVSVEAGLGFDAAMTRVGNELAHVSPDIAFEFLSTQHQIQAGRPREQALSDMARRTGLGMVQSFASVVQQSMRFGTSMSDALTTYASEMREYRETKAQEMANKLPVKMSAVLAALMLPTLMIVTAGPSILRYFRGFGG